MVSGDCHRMQSGEPWRLDEAEPASSPSSAPWVRVEARGWIPLSVDESPYGRNGSGTAAYGNLEPPRKQDLQESFSSGDWLGRTHACNRSSPPSKTADAIVRDTMPLPKLVGALKDTDSAIRYWGATGIGNIGTPALDAAEAPINSLLEDESTAVRTAAARALCRMGRPAKALPVLIYEMTTGAQWERLHAAIVLDEIDEMARPVAEQMREGLKYEKGFNSRGKYRVRVTNRALNELNGTDNMVE